MANLRRDKIIAATGAVTELLQAAGLHPAEGRVVVLVMAYGLGRTRADCAAPEVEALARELCAERDRAMRIGAELRAAWLQKRKPKGK